MASNFLLEIGTEEIPSRFTDSTLSQLKTRFDTMLNEERIKASSVMVYSTPRRLVLFAKGVADRQEDLEELVKGPSKKIAYDQEGNPAKALIGFTRGQKVTPEEVILKEYNGEEYVYAHKRIEGRLTKGVLEEKLSDMIKGISFPKSMKWGGKNLRFARPIRWLLALYNDQILNFDLEGITSSNLTRGHRFLGKDKIEIDTIDNYFDDLRENYVIVDQDERKKLISTGCNKLAREKGGNLLLDEALLHELTHIVEYPSPFIGRVKETYLDLPKEVIITPMKEHQRYIPVVDDEGNLMKYFIAVRNGNLDYIDIVAKGNEKVLDARLEDAKFFFEEDTKKPLEEYVEGLKEIVFQEQLGTLYEKTYRVQNLGTNIGNYLEVGEETIRNIQRAAYLFKADLVTKMVHEFTELQGTMGREYAKRFGENEIVSLAIYEHYLPRFAGDLLPVTTAGAILSIADKLDSIAGFFAIGLQPTGSQDPYGLRRQSLGIISTILDKGLHVSLTELISYALTIYKNHKGLVFDSEVVEKEILEFFMTRLKNQLIDNGIRYDVVDAVLATDTDDLADLVVRGEEINQWIEKDELNDILSAFNRVVNIAQKAESKDIDANSFEAIEEKELYQAFEGAKGDVKAYLNKNEYGKALDALIILREPIDNFFDKIMVMVEDEQIRKNRLALIRNIADTMLSICNLSKIVSK